MRKSFTDKHNLRKSFGKIPDLVDMPNLLEIQKNSYDLFLQKDVKPEDREDIGLQAVFNKVFPITDFSGIAELNPFFDHSKGKTLVCFFPTYLTSNLTFPLSSPTNHLDSGLLAKVSFNKSLYSLTQLLV